MNKFAKFGNRPMACAFATVYGGNPVMNDLALPTDELFQLERRIARRADELDRQLGFSAGHALDHWRQAEREVWAQSSLPSPVAPHAPQR